MAMFTAVAASAFVVRVRMVEECDRKRAMRMDPTPVALLETSAPGAGSAVFEDREKNREAGEVLGARATMTATEREIAARFEAAAARGDVEGALFAWSELPAGGPARASLVEARARLVRPYLEVQLRRLLDEVEARHCDAASERLARLARLLPDQPLPDAMAGCESRVGR